MTDKELLSYVIALYAYPAVSSASWDFFDSGLTDDGVCWAAKRVGDILVVVNRGSVTLHDFECDAAALLAFDHDLGPVHAGFFVGMRKQWAELAP